MSPPPSTVLYRVHAYSNRVKSGIKSTACFGHKLLTRFTSSSLGARTAFVIGYVGSHICYSGLLCLPFTNCILQYCELYFLQLEKKLIATQIH